MRAFLLALPVLILQPAASAQDTADQDTICARVYTFLSQSARSSGMSSSAFDNGANRAQDTHLVQNPGEDSQRYAVQVIDGAQTIRDGLTRGTISPDDVVTTATACNRRYFAEYQASGSGTPR